MEPRSTVTGIPLQLARVCGGARCDHVCVSRLLGPVPTTSAEVTPLTTPPSSNLRTGACGSNAPRAPTNMVHWRTYWTPSQLPSPRWMRSMSSAYLAWSPLILARIASTASVLPDAALCGQNSYFIESRWGPKTAGGRWYNATTATGQLAGWTHLRLLEHDGRLARLPTPHTRTARRWRQVSGPERTMIFH
jgi:hypothetical protein